MKTKRIDSGMSGGSMGILEMPPILPPKDETGMVQTGLRVPKHLMKELDAIAKASGYTRSQVMIRFLEWAAAEHRKEQKELKPKK